MKELKFLFDIPLYQKEKYSLDVALSGKENIHGKKFWKNYSTDDFVSILNQVSAGLLELGIKQGDKIALISNNRPEWNFLDLGMQQIGAVNVPVYPTITDSEYIFIFNDAEVKLCFVSNEELFKRVKSFQNKIPSLEKVFSFEFINEIPHWKNILKKSFASDFEKINSVKSCIDENETATIIYTSGTTGNPKGVMLTHKNLVSNINSILQVLPLRKGARALSFLPICHSFERTVSYTYMAACVSIFYAESIDTIGENIKEIKPNYFSTVPRLLEKVFEKIMQKGNSLKRIKKKLFFHALALGEKYEINKNLGWWYNFQLSLMRKIVFSKWIEALGGEIQIIVSGAAALQPKLARIFTAAGITILEGYGLTETSPVVCTNRLPEKERRFGTVGPALPGVEVKIAVDGEILVRGSLIMKGYYKRPDLTSEVIETDGWFHTGDIGEFVDGRFLKITDRKKELFKTSGGKYVAPQTIESKFKAHPLIEQIVVIGEYRKFVSALIVPSFLNLRVWCEKNNVPTTSNSDMITNKKVFKKFQEISEEINKDINKVEQVKKMALLANEWSLQTGELTPTLKIKRKVISEKFKNEIEKMYTEEKKMEFA